MNDDRLYPPCDISATVEDIHYQENNSTSEGFKSKQIHESLYYEANLMEVVTKCPDLTKQQQQQQLYQLLSAYPTLFDGVLKLFVGPKIHLELVDNLVPVSNPMWFPNTQLGIFKQELECLVSIRALEKA